MITNTLQKRISTGDREAFKAVYSEYGRGVFLTAMKALGSEADARVVVKQTFLNLHRDLLNAADDVDIPVRIRELTEHELLLSKILRSKGLLDAAAEVDGVPPSFLPPYGGASAQSASAEPDSEEEESPLPPLERAFAYMEADRAYTPSAPIKPSAAPKRPRRGRGFARFLLILLLLALLWALAGVMMDIQLIPAYNLGYRWFNETVYPLFSLFQ